VAQKVQFFSLWLALETVGTYYLPKVYDKSGWKRDETRFLGFSSGKCPEATEHLFFRKECFRWVLNHLHRKTGNSGCEIKFFAPFRMGGFRKHEL